MNRFNYLHKLAQTKPDDVWKTWQALGEMIITSSTKVYTEGTLFLVHLRDLSELYLDGQDLDYEVDNLIEVDGNDPHDPTLDRVPIDGALIYCVSDYIVDNNDFPMIDWENTTLDMIENSVQVYQGVNMPHFKVILTPEMVQAVKTPNFDDNFIPFQEAEIKTSIIEIAEDELEIILSEVGVPFLRIDELEYTRDVILNTCIKPALQQYYKFFPLLEEKVIGRCGAGSEFKFELPEFAYNAIVFYTLGVGGSSSATMSPFAFYASELMGGGMPSGAGGGMFGRGVSYRKPVPGFTGGAAARDAMMGALQAQQGYANQWRREKISKVKENGKIYMKGYSSLGGNLLAKIMKWSPDWDMVEFEHLPEVRQMCQAYILRNLAQLRSQIKADIPGAIDWNAFAQRGDALYERVIKFWNTTSESLQFTPQRGGL